MTAEEYKDLLDAIEERIAELQTWLCDCQDYPPCPACKHQPFLRDAGDGYMKVCCTNPKCPVRPSTPPFHVLDAIRHWNRTTVPDVWRRGFVDLTG